MRPNAPALAVLAAALLGGALSATPVGFDVLATGVASRASCNPGAGQSSGRSSCALTSPGRGVAYAETDLDGGRDYDQFGGFFESGFFMTVRAEAAVQNSAPAGNGSAQARITAMVTLHTDGALRPGYADFYALGGPFRCAWPDCLASVSVGSQTFTDLGGYRGRPPLYSVPIMLGTDLAIVLQAFAEDRDAGIGSVAASMAGIDISFREDNSRAVSMSRFAPEVVQTPEPGALTLLVVGALFLFARSRTTSK